MAGPLRFDAEHALISWIQSTTPATTPQVHRSVVALLDGLEIFCKDMGAAGYDMGFALDVATLRMLKALSDRFDAGEGRR